MGPVIIGSSEKRAPGAVSAPFLFSIHGFLETDYLESNNCLLLEIDTFLPNNRRLVSYNKSQTRSCHLTCNHCKYFRCQRFHYFSFIYPITTTCSTCRYGLSRFCSKKVKRLLRNMPKSCSKVAQY